MPTSNMRKPVPHHRRPAPKKQQHQFTTITREIIAIIAIGAMTGVMFWQSVFGMADDLARGPTLSVQMAMEAHDYGR